MRADVEIPLVFPELGPAGLAKNVDVERDSVSTRTQPEVMGSSSSATLSWGSDTVRSGGSSS